MSPEGGSVRRTDAEIPARRQRKTAAAPGQSPDFKAATARPDRGDIAADRMKLW
jgi:hypothetical protein